MRLDLKLTSPTAPINIAIRCPHCGHFGTFVPILTHDIAVQAFSSNIKSTTNYVGMRSCPNKSCTGQLFFIADKNKNILTTSPTESIPFDKTNIPNKVLNAFEEAVKCHSNSCFIASAIMIRKTLEEICTERGANGDNLFKKLQNLGKLILIPQDLLTGMQELRLLGNDAAHIEAQTFDDIGKEEIEVSLDFAKEILKAVYQYESLLQRLKNLKRKEN